MRSNKNQIYRKKVIVECILNLIKKCELMQKRIHQHTKHTHMNNQWHIGRLNAQILRTIFTNDTYWIHISAWCVCHNYFKLPSNQCSMMMKQQYPAIVATHFCPNDSANGRYMKKIELFLSYVCSRCIYAIYIWILIHKMWDVCHTQCAHQRIQW